MDELLSSRDAAGLLGVSPASVKRWADEGLLACDRTAGGHRRFTRQMVEDLRARLAGLPEAAQPPAREVHRWVDQLIAGGPPQQLESRLLALRGELRAWWQVAEQLGPVVDELGDRWARGKLSILQEHLASERLARALSRMSEWQPVAADAPRALLATPSGDPHTLGLSLLEPCLRELGWSTLWAGRNTPTAELERAAGDVDLIVISASSWSDDSRALGAEAEQLSRACRKHRCRLLLGGRGAWPAVVEGAVIAREWRSLPDLLARL